MQQDGAKIIMYLLTKTNLNLLQVFFHTLTLTLNRLCLISLCYRIALINLQVSCFLLATKLKLHFYK